MNKREIQLFDKMSGASNYEEDSFEDVSNEELEEPSISEMVEKAEYNPDNNVFEYNESIIDDEELSRSIRMGITSETPTSFDSKDPTFHLKFIRQPMTKCSLGNHRTNRINYSFTNEQMREIERHNRILLQKILTKKPTYVNPFAKKITQQIIPQFSRTSSAAVNRKKIQMQIDRENQILKRKIEAIACRRIHRLN